MEVEFEAPRGTRMVIELEGGLRLLVAASPTTAPSSSPRASSPSSGTLPRGRGTEAGHDRPWHRRAGDLRKGFQGLAEGALAYMAEQLGPEECVLDYLHCIRPSVLHGASGGGFRRGGGSGDAGRGGQ